MVLLLFVTTTTANNSTTVNNNSNDGKSTNKVTLMCETAQHSTICDSDQIPSPHTALGAFP